jgi:hypothetical protein
MRGEGLRIDFDEYDERVSVGWLWWDTKVEKSEIRSISSVGEEEWDECLVVSDKKDEYNEGDKWREMKLEG